MDVSPLAFGSDLTLGSFFTIGSFLTGFSALTFGSGLTVGAFLTADSFLTGVSPLTFGSGLTFGAFVAVGSFCTWDDGWSIFDAVVFFDGFEDLSPSVFFFVEVDGSVLAFLLGTLLAFPMDSDCFRFLPTAEGSTFSAGAMPALYCAFTFLSAAAYSFFISASILAILGGTFRLDWFNASNRRSFALALSFEGGRP